MTYLLDVNVLIALLDPWHVRHADAQAWFQAEGGAAWATCPIVQNGVIRIMGHPKYPGGSGSPATMAQMLKVWVSNKGHEFWPDDINPLMSNVIDPSQIRTPAQVTDTYLLALAAHRGGKLATFDHRLSTRAVRGGAAALRLL